MHLFTICFIHIICISRKVYVTHISRKTPSSVLLTTPKPLTVWITTNWKIPQEMGIPDHLTCLLRNLYAGQEATVLTGHRMTDWFQIGKGVCQGCVLLLWLFVLYAE